MTQKSRIVYNSFHGGVSHKYQSSSSSTPSSSISSSSSLLTLWWSQFSSEDKEGVSGSESGGSEGGGGEHNNNNNNGSHEPRHHQQHQYHQPAGLRGNQAFEIYSIGHFLGSWLDLTQWNPVFLRKDYKMTLDVDCWCTFSNCSSSLRGLNQQLRPCELNLDANMMFWFVQFSLTDSYLSFYSKWSSFDDQSHWRWRAFPTWACLGLEGGDSSSTPPPMSQITGW